MLPFFDKAPELVELNRSEVQIDHQVARNSFHVPGGFVQPGRDRVLVDFLDPGRCPNAIAFGQTCDHVVKGVFIRFQTKQRRAPTRGECPPTDFAF